jgi:hypothetical protein
MRTLYCTVGGSPAPIVTAIRHHKPGRVVFVCSDNDQVSGRNGSWTQVEGKGKVCMSKPGAPPDLPAIPVQVGLDRDAWVVKRVPADDAETAFGLLHSEVATSLDEGEAVVDYTGGTKSMSAALYMVGALTPGVEISLVTAPRDNLVRVVDGMEAVAKAGAGSVQEAWMLGMTRNAWKRYAYSEADRLLSQCRSQEAKIMRIRNLSR